MIGHACPSPPTLVERGGDPTRDTRLSLTYTNHNTMSKGKLSILMMAASLSLSCPQARGQEGMDQFIDELMAKMTVEEKIGQLHLMAAGDITTGNAVSSPLGEDIAGGRLGGVFNVKGVEKIRALQDIAVRRSRLGIPLIVGMDVIHGYETVFPIPLALAASWDMEAIERSARVAARECSADGICWTFSPMVDVAVDQRWGRVAEGAGEDPFLGSRVAEAMVRGYQGQEPYAGNDRVMACVKHFALYGASEGGKEYNTVDMSRLRMYNQYFPPYKAAVEAGAGSVMSSFNLVEGIHATANRWLLTDVLRGEWGFGGFVVTDYGSIGEFPAHGLGDLSQASVQSLQAGTDMDMCSRGFLTTLAQSLEEGRVSIGDIDRACRRVLEAKYRLGLFHDPYKYLDPKRREKDILSPENRETARRVAAETFVLLRNEGRLLPLQRKGKIALIGPLANTRDNLTGTWSVAQVPDKYLTLREAMGEALEGKAELLYAQGSNICYDEAIQRAGEFGKTIPRVDDAQALREALAVARQADVIVAALGESADMSGECASRSFIGIPDAQRDLLRALVATGKPVVLLNFAGRATELSWESAHVPAILNVWFGGSEAGHAICDVLFGEVNPSGRLPVSMPYATGQEPLYYNSLPTGRPVRENQREFVKYSSNWIDVPNGALYPFGYGLSYTTFTYGKPSLSSSVLSPDGKASLSVTVTNQGDRDGYEVVQLYIHDKVATISRPRKELRGFQRVFLKAGESKTVTFELTQDLMRYYDASLRPAIEPGEVTLMVGPDSRDLQSLDITLR